VVGAGGNGGRPGKSNLVKMVKLAQGLNVRPTKFVEPRPLIGLDLWRPTLIDPFEYERCIVNYPVHHAAFCHVGFVRLHLHQFARREERGSKENGVLSFFGHGSPQCDLSSG